MRHFIDNLLLHSGFHNNCFVGNDGTCLSRALWVALSIQHSDWLSRSSPANIALTLVKVSRYDLGHRRQHLVKESRKLLMTSGTYPSSPLNVCRFLAVFSAFLTCWWPFWCVVLTCHGRMRKEMWTHLRPKQSNGPRMASCATNRAIFP